MTDTNQVLIEQYAQEIINEMFWGHLGRPGTRGGSAPRGGGFSWGPKEASSGQMANYLRLKSIEVRVNKPEVAMGFLKKRFPGKTEDRYKAALKKAGIKSIPYS